VSDRRRFSLGSRGEREWQHLRAALTLSPERALAFVVADSGAVRDEVRRRLESLVSAVVRCEPGSGVLRRIHAITADSDEPPVVWIEASEGYDAQWVDALIALNRGRDLVWDHGPAFIVFAGAGQAFVTLRKQAPDLASVVNPVLLLDDTLESVADPIGPVV
jgi:hypothetical protein